MDEVRVRAVRAALSIIVIVGLQACADRATEPLTNVNAPPASTSMRLSCVATIRTAQVACSTPKPSATTTAVVLGGQGTYVQISASNVAYNSTTQIFQADLTVQNLTAQPLGTPDGEEVTGVDLVINSGPVGNGGAVAVNNATGTMTVTAPNQPYFDYPQIVDAFGGTSSPLTWRFNVPTSVTSFAFTVLVHADVPEAAGALRWDVERGFANYSNTLVYGADARNVFAFGRRYDEVNSDEDFNTLDRFNGVAWHSVSNNFPVFARAAWSSSPSDVWVAGDNGAIYHYDGTTWFDRSTPFENSITGIWGSSSTDMWITAGGAITHYDGTSTGSPVGIAGSYKGISGTAANNIWAVGDAGAVAHYTGSGWSYEPISGSPYLVGVYASGSQVWAVGSNSAYHYAGGVWSPATAPPSMHFAAIHGSDSTNVWATGYHLVGDFFLRAVVRWNVAASTWEIVADNLPVDFSSIWTSGPNDVWLVGESDSYETDGVPYHWDGISLTAVGSHSGITQVIQSANATFGISANDVWVVGTAGLLLHNTGSGWKQAPNVPRTPGRAWNGVWGLAADNIWIVGDSGRTLHWDGELFVPLASGTTGNLTGVYGFAANDIYAVADCGDIVHYNGTAWSVVKSTGYRLNAIWGSGPTNIYAVGQGDVQHGAGTVWSPESHPGGQLFAVRGAPDGHVIAVGDEGLILCDCEGWLSTTSGTDSYLRGLYSDGAAGPLLAVGSRGTVLRKVGIGQSSQWVPVAAGLASDIHAVWYSGLDNIILGGVGEFIAHGRR